MIKLKGYITYNIGGPWNWIRIGRIKIEYIKGKK
jgi:hypothetical protein